MNKKVLAILKPLIVYTYKRIMYLLTKYVDK